LQTFSLALAAENRRKELPMELTYTLVGDYYLPDLTLNEPPDAQP
jgi:hypothetical protein